LESTCRETVRHTNKEQTINYIGLNEEKYDAAPTDEIVSEVIAALGYQLWVPEGASDEMDPFQHAHNAECMACGTPLGEDTIIMVDGRGILGIWHQPECMSNMHALSFLRRVEDSVVEAIDAAGGVDGGQEQG
jgi:hypothetical protein